MGLVRENIIKNLGKYLKNRRMTQKELANQLGVAQSSVTNWLKGDNSPDLEIIAKICHILEININDLLEIDEAVYSEVEKNIIFKYRKKVELQSAIKKLLDIEED